MKPESAEPTLHPSLREELEWADDATRTAMLAAPDSWAITQERLDAYRNTFLPCLDLELHPLRRDETFARLLETVMAYVEGDMEMDACLERLREVAEGR